MVTSYDVQILPTAGGAALSDGSTVTLLACDLPPVNLLAAITRARQHPTQTIQSSTSSLQTGTLGWAAQLQSAAGSEQLAVPIQLDRCASLCSGPCSQPDMQLQVDACAGACIGTVAPVAPVVEAS